jgi:hypothetical protein
MNFTTNTDFEQLQEDKKNFSNGMPVLAGLTEDEQRALIHLIENSRSKASLGEEDLEDVYDDVFIHQKHLEEKTAKVSEEANFELKNVYRHNKLTMNYANKKRMKVNVNKVVDLLKHSHLYRAKIVKEEATFENELMNTQMENGVLSYLNEAAWGDLRELITDLGIRDETIPFVNLAQLNKLRENNIFQSDSQIRVFANSLFKELDLTDYEEAFVNWQELPGAQGITHSEKLLDLQ